MTRDENEYYQASLVQMKMEADHLTKTQVSDKKPNYDLVPLGLGLRLIADLYSILLPLSLAECVSTLFDGGQTEGPNLDTRFRQIRGLLDAVQYHTAKLSEEQAIETSHHNIGESTSIGPDRWELILASYVSNESRQEVARLLDDVHESAMCICEHLRHDKTCLTGSSVDWSEVDRHVVHIVDHIEYAEDMLIESMRKAEDH